jgi:hypothetical protein
MICDFCHGLEPRWRFDARPFVVDYGSGIQSASDAGWAACDACCALVLADNRADLVERAMQIAPPIPGATENEVRQLRLWVHGLFFRYRLPGEPALIEANQS